MCSGDLQRGAGQDQPHPGGVLRQRPAKNLSAADRDPLHCLRNHAFAGSEGFYHTGANHTGSALWSEHHRLPQADRRGLPSQRTAHAYIPHHLTANAAVLAFHDK